MAGLAPRSGQEPAPSATSPEPPVAPDDRVALDEAVAVADALGDERLAARVATLERAVRTRAEAFLAARPVGARRTIEQAAAAFWPFLSPEARASLGGSAEAFGEDVARGNHAGIVEPWVSIAGGRVEAVELRPSDARVLICWAEAGAVAHEAASWILAEGEFYLRTPFDFAESLDLTALSGD